MKVMCYGLFACAFNLLIGYVGMLAFGHAMFFGGAGYIAGYSLKVLGLPPELALLLAVAFAFSGTELIGIAADAAATLAAVR